MKKILLTVILLTVISFGINGQTNVSGGIYSNTVWTLANSPYIVTDTVVVFPGVTLTIQPGVTVKFANNKRLEIRQATLIAQGTLTDSITFTSNSGSPTQGIWSSILLNNVVNTSRFNFCNIFYANYGICGTNNYIGGYAYIKNSNFKYNNWGIRFLYSATCFLDSCNFRNNTTGLLVYATVTGGQIDLMKINRCTFINNQVGANLWGGTTIANSIIDSNTMEGVIMEQYQDSVIHNEIKYNGIGIRDNSAISYGYGTITQNIIENNNIGIKLENWKDSIFCNKICNNTTYDFQYNVAYGSNVASIRHNYWCTTDSAIVAAHIYDGYDNISLGLVNFMPIDTTQCYLDGCPLIVSATVTNATCDTCHNGSASGHVAYGFPPYTWTWYTSPIQTTQTASGLAPGTYTLCVTDGHGCHACDSTIYVDSTNCNGYSINTFASNATCSTCYDGSAWVNVSGGTPPYSYTWYTSPMQSSDTATGLTHGTYHICVTDLYGCTVCDSVIVSTGNCSAHFNLYPDSILAHHYFAVNMTSGVPPFSYYWEWGDGTHDTIALPSHTYSNAGFYTICLTITDSVGCTNIYCDSFYLLKNTNTMVYVNVIPQTGITESSINKSFLIYPNPASVYLTLRFAQNISKAEIKIYNLLGELKSTSRKSSTESNINISDLSNGVYIIEVTTERNIMRQKFIKQ